MRTGGYPYFRTPPVLQSQATLGLAFSICATASWMSWAKQRWHLYHLRAPDQGSPRGSPWALIFDQWKVHWTYYIMFTSSFQYHITLHTYHIFIYIYIHIQYTYFTLYIWLYMYISLFKHSNTNGWHHHSRRTFGLDPLGEKMLMLSEGAVPVRGLPTAYKFTVPF